jgi:hypothetical protein
MSFTYPQAVIGANSYDVYIDLADANAYLAASLSSSGQAWVAPTTSDTLRTQGLVAATRWLDSGQWQGSKTDPANDLQFPRSGLVYADGVPVDPATLPPPLADACAELAAALVADPDLRDELQNPVPKHLAAGSVNIDFFRPLGITRGAKDVQVLTFFPTLIMDMLGMWLQGSAGQTGPVITGTDKRNPLDDNFGFVHGF